MLDINQALMRRGKAPTPVKRKRPPAAQKKVTLAASASAMLRFSRAPEKPSQPTVKQQVPSPDSHPSSPPPSESTASLFQTPPVAVPTRQSYLDLGQKDFGSHVTCRKCGLLYTAGEEEDEKEHRRFCRDVQRGITIPKWKNERLLKSFPDDNARIIEIREGDAPLHVKKLLEVKSALDDALGFVEEDVFLKRGHFIFVQAKQVVGCVTVERITSAVVLEQRGKVMTTINSDSPATSGTVPAVLGICQLWVHPHSRGKRIATRLVDVVREKYIYGMHITKTRVAFSQPTRNGLGFATSYVAPHRVLVYEDSAASISPPVALSASTLRTAPVKRALLP